MHRTTTQTPILHQTIRQTPRSTPTTTPKLFPRKIVIANFLTPTFQKSFFPAYSGAGDAGENVAGFGFEPFSLHEIDVEGG